MTGEGTWVTGFATTKEKTIRILLVNFDPNGSHTETVPVTITNLEPGNYTVQENFLFGRDTKTQKTISDEPYEQQLYMPSQSVAIIELTKTD